MTSFGDNLCPFLSTACFQLQTLDQNLMATLGQIVLLVQGLYDARRNKEVVGNDKIKDNDEEGGET